MNPPACESVPLESVRRPPIIGWRCWFVYEDELTLRPIYRRGLAWAPRQAMAAVCPNAAHPVPDTDCRCGVWTVREPKNLREIHWTTDPPEDVDPLPGVLVVGQVALWGAMIEHERGWRAEYAYPRHLYAFTDNAELAAALRDRYLVPVEHGERAEALRARLPKPAATTTQPSAPPPAPKPKARPPEVPSVVIRRAAIDPLPDGPLRQAAERRLFGHGHVEHALDHWSDSWTSADSIRSTLGMTAGLRVVRRAAEGDVTAARRIVWARIAIRWREAESAYRAVLKAEVLAARTTHRHTGKPLAPTTLAQRKADVERAYTELERVLRELVDIPTPSYREWRRMFT